MVDRFPIRVVRIDGVWKVDWCRLGDERFSDPFFEQTVARCLQRPINQAFRTLTPIDEIDEARDVLAPAGLIFHVSRSGSTLVTQTLDALPQTLVFSEPVPVDDVLRSRLYDFTPDDALCASRLRKIVAALGAVRRDREERLILKLDCWHVFDLPLFELAFPGVPYVFVYRDPVEVVRSHGDAIAWGMSAANAPVMLGIETAAAMRMPRPEYLARALGRMFEAALAYGVDRESLVNYAELPEAIWEKIASRFGIDIEPRFAEAMRAAARRDAKEPHRTFASEHVERTSDAERVVREATTRFARDAYDRLEAARTAVNYESERSPAARCKS